MQEKRSHFSIIFKDGVSIHIQGDNPEAVKKMIDGKEKEIKRITFSTMTHMDQTKDFLKVCQKD